MNKVLITLLLIFSSCDSFYKQDERIIRFENILKLKLTFESNFNGNSKFMIGKNIERPAGSWQRLLTSDNFCLNYKIPLLKKNGVLQLVSTSKEGECPKLPSTKEIISIEGISNLKIKFTTDHIQGKSVRNGIYGINLNYDYNAKNRNLNIVLPNKERSKSYIKTKLIKYSSSGTYRQDKGVRITQDSMKKLRTSLWYGEWESKEITFCERKNDQCEIVGNSNCDECLYGWDYLVDFNCSGGGSKACSPVECGKKGKPACVRGIQWSGRDMRELCFNDSPAGFCQDDLKTICGEDGVLICI
ncbi:hypothetical protein [Halobacteriovorax sp.]|uniref:hypothetical protein n=1 Tax=Halobacteriovorax sp. TaxID=2020862 RepID=UPI003565D117